MVSYGSHEGLIGLEAIMSKVEGIMRDRMEGCATDLLSTLKSRTPIDKGRARASWQAYVDSYTQSGMTDEPPFVGGVEIDVRANNRARFLSAPRTSKVSGINFDPKKNTNIVISSNVPYMARLNRGWSRQASAGWIESCIDEVTSRWGVI